MAKPSKGIEIRTRSKPEHAHVLSAAALGFVASLHRAFEDERRRLLAARAERQKIFDVGGLPDFLAETAAIRSGEWEAAPLPPDLRNRRVEITGPPERKMMMNALNSGAKIYMADFEDSSAPTFANMIEGQHNLINRWGGTLDFSDPVTGRNYTLSKKPAVLMTRPRGWHLNEEHIWIDGAPVSASLFDFGLTFFHTAKETIAAGSGPYFYLPKLESHREARLWNQVFVMAQSLLGLPLGTIKATVLIETLPAAFEMDEIIFELRDHIAGLNCGRWDYIFSYIKTFAHNKKFVLPDRGGITMGDSFLAAYSTLLIKTCHRRGVHAMGGMAAQIPNRKDLEANEAAVIKVTADKRREARNGHDGTWVAHPDLVPVAMDVFNEMMPTPNQLYVKREDAEIGQKDLLHVPAGARTEKAFRENIRVGVQYIAAWLGGRGAVPLYNLMEDAATAEISRSQIWQWLKAGVKLDGGPKVTTAFFNTCLAQEMKVVKEEIGKAAYASGRFREAITLFRALCTAKTFVPFLTIPAYRKII